MPSGANVETLRQVFDAFNSGEIGHILAFAHPDFEAIVPPELSAEPDTYHGHEGIRRYFQSFHEVMEEIHFRGDKFWEAGESVVADVRLSARGRQTAILVEQHIAQVWTMRDGMALRVQTYVSLSDALQAVGLRE